MVTEEKARLNGDGDPEELEETQDELQTVRLKLQNLKRGDGSVVSLSRKELSLLQRTLIPPKGDDDLEQLLIMAEYMSVEEADDVTAAIVEAQRYGMSLAPIRYKIENRMAVNETKHRTSRVAQIFETLSHQKFTTNAPKGHRNDNANPRSPIA